MTGEIEKERRNRLAAVCRQAVQVYASSSLTFFITAKASAT